MQPIHFCGEPFTATKTYFSGSHRLLSPEETWEKIAPLASRFGVKRIAHIGGLDRIGIPVTLAIRPASLSVATSSGKGMSRIGAEVSGLMEALELHCAEEIDLPYMTLSYKELEKREEVIPLSRLGLRNRSLFHSSIPEKWVLGWDLVSGKEIAVPLASVTMDYRKADLPFFVMSSNGLASGNHFLEAVVSSLYELIERDAITCHSQINYASPKVRLETIRYSSVRQLLDLLESAQIELQLFDCSVDTEVPVFMSIIYDRLDLQVGVNCGYGAHLDPEVAMIRAITEAAQGRAIAISGSRDDLFLSQFNYLKKMDTSRARESYQKTPATIDAATYSSEASPTFEQDIHLLMQKLQKVGLNQILVFDLSTVLGENPPISVTRVIVPGLEGYQSPLIQIGERAKKFTAQTHLKKGAPIPLLSHFPAGAPV